MKMMKDLPFPDLPSEGKPSEEIEYTLPEDTLLDDSGFSDKEEQIAKAGDVVKLKTWPNYGMVKHPVHGIFRY